MGKLILLLLPLLIVGCEQTFNNLVDMEQSNYQVTLVSPADSVAYNADDSLITISITFTFSSEVNEVYCDIYSSDNVKLNDSPFQLVESTNNRFQNDFPLSTFYPNGVYRINYFVKDTGGSLKFVAVGNFKYQNGQDNISPVISNVVVDPDTIEVTQPTVIFTSVAVADSNGQNDILKVIFLVYKPDGSTNHTELRLYDDGDMNGHGDSTAGDGIFSRLIQVDQTNDKGTYRFEYRAKDRSGAYSNTIDHFVLIQ